MLLLLASTVSQMVTVVNLFHSHPGISLRTLAGHCEGANPANPHSDRALCHCPCCFTGRVVHVAKCGGCRELFMTAAQSIKTPVMTLPIRTDVAGGPLKAARTVANRLRRLRLAEVLEGTPAW